MPNANESIKSSKDSCSDEQKLRPSCFVLKKRVGSVCVARPDAVHGDEQK
jgi:hypothetical protein